MTGSNSTTTFIVFVVTSSAIWAALATLEQTAAAVLAAEPAEPRGLEGLAAPREAAPARSPGANSAFF